MKDSTKTYSRNIRQARIARDMTQEEVAFFSDLQTSRYGQIERGANATADTLSRIASTLGLEMVDLFKEKPLAETEDLPLVYRQAYRDLPPSWKRLMRLWIAMFFWFKRVVEEDN